MVGRGLPHAGNMKTSVELPGLVQFPSLSIHLSFIRAPYASLATPQSLGEQDTLLLGTFALQADTPSWEELPSLTSQKVGAGIPGQSSELF